MSKNKKNNENFVLKTMVSLDFSLVENSRRNLFFDECKTPTFLGEIYAKYGRVFFIISVNLFKVGKLS